MRIKLFLATALLVLAIVAGANDNVKKKESAATVKSSEAQSVKAKPTLPRVKKATEIVLQDENDNKYDAVVVNNNVATTYKPIFEEKKIKLTSKKESTEQ